jgi:hypothetical protein
MGHTTIQTTMIYAHLAPTDLFVGADVLDQVSPTVSDGSNNVVSMGQNRDKWYKILFDPKID